MDHPNNTLAVEALLEIMPSWHRSDITDVTYLPGGYSNTNFKVTHENQHYVLRIPGVQQPYVDRQEEARLYENVPLTTGAQAMALDERTGILLTRWVEGTLLADAREQVTLEELARYLQGLHKAIPATDRQYDVNQINKNYWSARMPPFQAEEPHPDNLVTCHNDLNPWNVILTESGWITLDWEFVGRNDPLFDVVNLHQGLGYDLQSLEALAELYFGRFDDVIETRLQHCRKAFWVRELGWAQFQIDAGNDRREVLDQRAEAQQILAKLSA